MELVRWEPFEGLNKIQFRINDLFDETFGRSRAQQTSTAGVWLPSVPSWTSIWKSMMGR